MYLPSRDSAEARQALEHFAATWDAQHPKVAQSWRNHWDNLITQFEYPLDIRKVNYTTNVIESLNSVIRKATQRRKLFPIDKSAMKVVHLAIQHIAKKWTMPIREHL